MSTRCQMGGPGGVQQEMWASNTHEMHCMKRKYTSINVLHIDALRLNLVQQVHNNRTKWSRPELNPLSLSPSTLTHGPCRCVYECRAKRWCATSHSSGLQDRSACFVYMTKQVEARTKIPVIQPCPECFTSDSFATRCGVEDAMRRAMSDAERSSVSVWCYIPREKAYRISTSGIALTISNHLVQ
jgi:hypothetical protein